MLYFDHASATPLEPAAQAAVAAALQEAWGNPDSAHLAGRRARGALEHAAIQAAELVGCAAVELRLEADAGDALARALEFALALREGPVVSTAIEHSCIDEPLGRARAGGRELRCVPTPAGDLGPPDAAICADAAVLVLSALNHELGTAPELAAWQAAAPNATVIVDAVQAASWLELAPLVDARTFVVIGSRKLGGPDGAAALRCPAELLVRWDRARGRSRVAVPAAVGFGAACEARRDRRPDALARARRLGERLRERLLAAGDHVHDDSGRSWLGPIVNVAVHGAEGRALDAELDLQGVAVARTSACRRELDAHSRVVAHAHPHEPWRARSCLRFSLGWGTTIDEVDAAAATFAAIVRAPASEEGVH